jgi:hypothetical protein
MLGEVAGRLDRLEAAQQQAQQAQQAAAAANGTANGAANGVSAKKGRKGSKAAVTAAAAPPVGAGVAEELAAAGHSAARGVALLSQLLEHGRGCRVESYAPLFKLASRLAQPAFVGGSNSSGGTVSSSSGGKEGEGEEGDEQALPYGASAVFADFLEPPLSAQVSAGQAKRAAANLT